VKYDRKSEEITFLLISYNSIMIMALDL